MLIIGDLRFFFLVTLALMFQKGEAPRGNKGKNKLAQIVSMKWWFKILHQNFLLSDF